MAQKELTKISIVIGIIAVIFLPSLAKYQELRSKEARLDAQIKALKTENKRLEEEKSRLETDITYVEKRARDKIGLVRKGEIVIQGETRK